MRQVLASYRSTGLLLLLLLWSVAASLTGIAQGLDSNSSAAIVVLAIALGWALAGAKQSGIASGWVAGLAGLGLISLQVGRLGDEYLRLAGSALSPIANLLSRGAIPVGLSRGEFPVGPAAGTSLALERIVQALGALLSGHWVLVTRFWNWLANFVTGSTAIDPVASALAWSLLLWAAAVWAAWWSWRQSRPLVAVFPALTLLGTTLYLSRSSHGYLLLPLASTLLLLAFSGHEGRLRRWKSRRVAHPEGMLTPLLLSAFPVTMLLVVAAALAPDLSVKGVREFGRRIGGRPVAVDGGLPQSLGLSRASRPGTGFEPLLIAGLPNRHLIGAGPELSQQIVMTITLPGLPAESAIPRLNWRALTYDRYVGRGWQTSSLAIQAFDAGQALVDEIPSNRQLLLQRVQGVEQLDGLAYSAGELVSVDHDFDLAWRELGRDPFAATLAADDYSVESLLPEVTQSELGAAGIDYPTWVVDHYLDLPAELPQRVLALARDLTATAATPYDRAIELERYLRAIPYTLDVSAPPVGRDVVDYFLFDLQRGYCDYYASSMVVLSRAAGLPARLVVGYFMGEPERTDDGVRYVVTEADAHSWAELYFPGIGWVEFEPTAGRPAIERQVERPPEPVSEPAELQPGQQLRAQRWAGLGQATARVVAGICLTLLAAGLAWTAWDTRRLHRLTPGQAIAELYRRFFASMGGIGAHPSPGDTPLELQSAYHLQAAGGDRRADLLRGGEAKVGELVRTHLAASFGPRPADSIDRNRAVGTWRRLRPRLWLVRLLGVSGRWGMRRSRSVPGPQS